MTRSCASARSSHRISLPRRACSCSRYRSCSGLVYGPVWTGLGRSLPRSQATELVVDVPAAPGRRRKWRSARARSRAVRRRTQTTWVFRESPAQECLKNSISAKSSGSVSSVEPRAKSSDTPTQYPSFFRTRTSAGAHRSSTPTPLRVHVPAGTAEFASDSGSMCRSGTRASPRYLLRIVKQQ